ncbi:MAG: thiolase family protein [Bdellovibrio sp.]|nr:thiolase family protein [Bdellovibrio sp.]
MSVYILNGARTAVGSFMGGLSTIRASELGATAIKAAVNRSEIEGTKIDQVYMGLVVAAGAGQAPARQATIFAGLGEDVPAATVNKVCGSGLMSIVLGAQSIMTGDSKLVVSGGMENMSLTPHLLYTRTPSKFGNVEMRDSMLWDGLWDVYTDRAMGECAEECAKKFNFTRQAQDEYAISSFKRAQAAIQDGTFKKEIVPVVKKEKGKDIIVDQDEGPFKANFEKIPALRPAFLKDGTITAANASTINDGAAAVVLGDDSYKSKARFKIVSYAFHAQNPTWFTTAPVMAMKKCSEKAKIPLEKIGLFEINEAFAVVAMSAIKELQLDRERVNIYGSGISLGHPIGATGTRIVVTLMNALEQKRERYGMASLCIGGGEALAMIIERLG